MNKLIDLGFEQCFPFVSFFQKRLSETSSIKINTCYFLKRNDVVEDSNKGTIFIRVTKINLPHSETKIFKDIDNCIAWLS